MQAHITRVMIIEMNKDTEGMDSWLVPLVTNPDPLRKNMINWLPKEEYHRQQIINLTLALKNPTSNHQVIKKLIKEHKRKLEKYYDLSNLQ